MDFDPHRISSVPLRDVVTAMFHWELWSRMAWMDIRRRYRRTVLGPFWTTLSMSIFVSTIGILYAYLWHMEIHDYLPYLVAGVLSWTLIATIVQESGGAFINAEAIIKQISIPYSLFLWVVVYRNILAYLHNIAVFIVVVIAFDVPVNGKTLLVIPGLLILCINCWWIGLMVATICTRFRDMQQLIQNIMQILLFITPVLWPRSQLGDGGQLFVDVNILYHYIDLIRAPLLGTAPAALSWEVSLVSALVGWTITLFVFSKVRHRLTYWL